jgi:hypothetical protein
MPERDKKPSSDADDLIPRSMLPDRPPPRPRTEAKRIPLEKIEAMMGETKEGEKIVKKSKGGGLPDLTGDGKITRADVLKGRGVFKKGGSVKSSASRRADGIAQRGKTRGKFV